MKEFYTKNELVRDKIPDIIRQNGCAANYIVVKDDFLYNIQLCNKLVAESKEVCGAKTKEELIEELADCMTVMRCIMEQNKISTEQVNQVMEKKEKEKGSFKDRIFLQTYEKNV